MSWVKKMKPNKIKEKHGHKGYPHGIPVEKRDGWSWYEDKHWYKSLLGEVRFNSFSGLWWVIVYGEGNKYAGKMFYKVLDAMKYVERASRQKIV